MRYRPSARKTSVKQLSHRGAPAEMATGFHGYKVTRALFRILRRAPNTRLRL